MRRKISVFSVCGAPVVAVLHVSAFVLLGANKKKCVESGEEQIRGWSREERREERYDTEVVVCGEEQCEEEAG